MTPVDIDRIVRAENGIEPSPHFTSRVMRAVRADVADRRARRFAWRQAWQAAAAASLVVPVAIASMALDVGAIPTSPADPMFLLTLTMVGTAALVSWYTRLLTRR
jgi:hypothetical protein